MRKMLTVLAAVMALVIASPLGVGVSRANSAIVAHDFLSSIGCSPLFGDTHMHSNFSDGFNKPEWILKEAVRQQDFAILTDHAEQLSLAEGNKLQQLAEKLQSSGKLVGIDSEWTGTPEYKDEQGHETHNPAKTAGYGHMLVYGSDAVIGQGMKKGGEPTLIAPTFARFLSVVQQAARGSMTVFAHPSLYRTETSFDVNDDGQGFDEPPNPELIEGAVGCELSSHTLGATEGYRGPGDGHELKSSNEACYRLLLRRGWQVAPFMSTDRHEVLYRPGPWTVVFAQERTIESVYDAFYDRRTCASEERGVSLAMVLSTEDRTIYPMGSEIPIANLGIMPTLYFSLRNKQGEPVRAKALGTVIVFAEREEVGGSLKEWTNVPQRLRLSEGEDALFLGHLIAQKAVCVYAKATLSNGKQLISAPVFFRH